MKEIHIGIFGIDPNIYATHRIIEELEKKSIQFTFFSHKDIIYTSNTIFHKNEPIKLDELTHVFFRTPGYTDDNLPFSFRLENEINILMKKLKKHNVKILNESLFTQYPFYNKFTQSQIFAEENIPTPDTFHINNNDPRLIESILSEKGWNFPIVLKYSSGSQGKTLFLIHSSNELERELYSKRNTNLIFQRFTPCKEDYRVLILGNKSLGVMKRSGNGDWRHNFSLGGSVAFMEDSEMETFAINCCQKIGFEYAGVDIIKDANDSYQVLEINLTPGFEGFEKATKANVAKQILQYLVQK